MCEFCERIHLEPGWPTVDIQDKSWGHCGIDSQNLPLEHLPSVAVCEAVRSKEQDQPLVLSGAWSREQSCWGDRSTEVASILSSVPAPLHWLPSPLGELPLGLCACPHCQNGGYKKKAIISLPLSNTPAALSQSLNTN